MIFLFMSAYLCILLALLSPRLVIREVDMWVFVMVVVIVKPRRQCLDVRVAFGRCGRLATGRQWLQLERLNVVVIVVVAIDAAVFVFVGIISAPVEDAEPVLS